MTFLLSFGTEVMEPLIGVGAYFSFVTRLCLAFGLVFELPLLVLFLSVLGIVNPVFLLRAWRYAIIVIAFMAAILTPPDVISQVMMAGPVLLLYLGSVLVSIAAIPVVLAGTATPEHHETAVRIDLPRMFRISPAGALGSLTAGLTNGAFWSLAPVFVASYSSSLKITAGFMTAAVLGGAAGQWPLGLWSDRVDRRWVIVFAALVGTVIGLALWWAGPAVTPAMLLALSAAWGATAFPLYSVSAAHANDYARANEFVMISSGLLLMYGIGAIVGPFLASLAMEWIDAGGLYLFTALTHVLLAGYIVFRISQRAPPDRKSVV